MAKLNVAPTKSVYLNLRRQLAFAEEGYDLLDQKRQILIFELMSRLGRARDAERRVAEGMAKAYAALREALLQMGSDSLDRANLAVQYDHKVDLAEQPLMGIRVPKVTVAAAPMAPQFSFAGTSAFADRAMKQFVEVLKLLGELAELENAVLRLAQELRKTQRRVNALSKIFIPNYTETLTYITSSLEERERESFVIMKMIKRRLGGAVEGGGDHG
jgi:V/A-type H+-transporting ATPase subunit D